MARSRWSSGTKAGSSRAKSAEFNEPGCRIKSRVAAYGGDTIETPSRFVKDTAPNNEPAFGARVRRG